MAVLERPSEPVPAPPVRGPARDVPLLEQHLSARRPVEAAENVDERGLARSVRADQPDDLALPQLERDVPQSLDARERAGDGGGPECSSGPPLRLGPVSVKP